MYFPSWPIVTSGVGVGVIVAVSEIVGDKVRVAIGDDVSVTLGFIVAVALEATVGVFEGIAEGEKSRFPNDDQPARARITIATIMRMP